MVELTLYSLGGWLALIFMGMLVLVSPIVLVIESRQRKQRKTARRPVSEIGSNIYYIVGGGSRK